MENQVIFDQLVKNSLDFLEKSIDEFDQSPKFSLIHFCIAIELLFKARLAHEHWTLIVLDINKVQSKEKFLGGDVKTISHSEALIRIETILEENLASSIGEQIKNLFGVRNRLIHFLGNTSGEGIKEETISHQLVSWHNLYNLYLDKSWKEIFKGYNKEISALDHKLRKHKKYLKIRFDHKIPIIEKLKKIGKQFTTCPVCGFHALSEEQISSCLKNFKCHVCSYETRHYDILTCPACSDYIVMDSNEDVCFCKGCKKNFQADEVVEAFKEVNPLTKDNYFEGHPIAHCIECFGLDCVLQIDEGNLWVCVYCKGEYTMQEVSHCEWCNDLNAGNLEDSFLIGCNACTGNHDFK